MALRLLFVLLALAPGGAWAAEPRSWRVDRLGVIFERSAQDLRAWKGTQSGAPAFSIQALLAEEKARFDKDVAEGAREFAKADARDDPSSVATRYARLEPLSVVGPLVAYRSDFGEDWPGTAHPSRMRDLSVMDVTRPGAAVSLLDYFPEKHLVDALKADPWIREFADPEGGFAEASSLDALFAALDRSAGGDAEAGDGCTWDANLHVNLVRSFAFHHLEKDRVAVRLFVPPYTMFCARLGTLHQVGLLLPVPESLRHDLQQAAAGKAGFLAKDLEAQGSPSYEAEWKADLAVHARKLRGRSK